MSETAYIAIGSNLGDRAGNCKKAIKRLEACKEVDVVKRSSLYETPPWGNTDQEAFINCVVEVKTALVSRELLRALKAVESELGRTPGRRWGPRVIDLDIIFYGESVIEEEGLKVPHPLAHKRAFVMVPLAEIAPEFTHPVKRVKVRELLGAVEGTERVKRVA